MGNVHRQLMLIKIGVLLNATGQNLFLSEAPSFQNFLNGSDLFGTSGQGYLICIYISARVFICRD